MPKIILKSIRITKLPNKTTYKVGDLFNPEGMIVLATYSDNSSSEVSDYTYKVDPISIEDRRFTIQYSERGVTVSRSIILEVLGWTISFYDSADNLIIRQTVLDSSQIAPPPSEVREGYEFLGWHTDPIDGDKISDFKSITNDINLYSRYRKASELRLKSISGKVDKQSVLDFSSDKVANSGESLVTDLVIELEDKALESYRIYFEFLLPVKLRFISEPLVAKVEQVEDIDPATRHPYMRDALLLKYTIPAYVSKFPGPLVVNLKATNDSITIWKSKTYTLIVDETVDPIDDNRYFSGDLLDFLVTTKLDKLRYKEGWLISYISNPNTGEEREVNRFPVHPLFSSVAYAEEWAINDPEATIGQMITVLYQNDPYSPQIVTSYLINPDRTLSHVMTEGTTFYDDLLRLPTLTTISTDGSLEPKVNEVITGEIKLSKLAKTARLSDAINDRGFSTLKLHRIREAGDPVIYERILTAQDGEYQIIIEYISFNTPLNEGDKISIEIGADEVVDESTGDIIAEDTWRTVLDQDDIDITKSNISYGINQSYGFSHGEYLRVVVISESNNISIDMELRHS